MIFLLFLLFLPKFLEIIQRIIAYPYSDLLVSLSSSLLILVSYQFLKRINISCFSAHDFFSIHTIPITYFARFVLVLSHFYEISLYILPSYIPLAFLIYISSPIFCVLVFRNLSNTFHFFSYLCLEKENRKSNKNEVNCLFR